MEPIGFSIISWWFKPRECSAGVRRALPRIALTVLAAEATATGLVAHFAPWWLASILLVIYFGVGFGCARDNLRALAVEKADQQLVFSPRDVVLDFSCTIWETIVWTGCTSARMLGVRLDPFGMADALAEMVLKSWWGCLTLVLQSITAVLAVAFACLAYWQPLAAMGILVLALSWKRVAKR